MYAHPFQDLWYILGIVDIDLFLSARQIIMICVRPYFVYVTSTRHILSFSYTLPIMCPPVVLCVHSFTPLHTQQRCVTITLVETSHPTKLLSPGCYGTNVSYNIAGFLLNCVCVCVCVCVGLCYICTCMYAPFLVMGVIPLLT
jgi:hypothetical protein